MDSRLSVITYYLLLCSSVTISFSSLKQGLTELLQLPQPQGLQTELHSLYLLSLQNQFYH